MRKRDRYERARELRREPDGRGLHHAAQLDAVLAALAGGDQAAADAVAALSPDEQAEVLDEGR